ncbi:MAG: hypothetical protein V1777_02200 [Candidatus Micrarchaeota archaeon]
MAKKKSVVLVPVLSKLENNPSFLERVTAEADEVVVLAVIDQSGIVGNPGFAIHEIKVATQLAEEIAALVVASGKKSEAIVEWGETVRLIAQLAELKSCSAIFLVEQKNQYYQKLREQIREKTACPLVEVKVFSPSVVSFKA